MLLRFCRILEASRAIYLYRPGVRNASSRYRDSLNLPKTTFPLSMKDGAVTPREKRVRQASGLDELYEWQRNEIRSKNFVLHDGPPYANGKPHVGHVLNKVLKDITVKYKILTGHKVHYIPGWDCHGVPIEQKALADLRVDNTKLTPLDIRNTARKFATKVIKDQKTAFQSWAITGDWKKPYVTFDGHYEAKQLKVFFEMYKKGMIYQDFMPVHWSPSSGTALAEAELEYNEKHVSTSLYVKFPLQRLPDALWNALGKDDEPFALIWTTTPWTLPSNQAICYGEGIKYCFVHNPKTMEAYLISVDFFEQLKSLLRVDLTILCTMDGSELSGTVYRHPLLSKSVQKLLPARHVTVAKGTGLVHTAPAHGTEDFQVAVNHDIPIKCLVDEEGKFTADAGSSLAGKFVLDEGSQTVMSLMHEQILHREEFTHSYPYDWRTKQPVILRASKQWFVNTSDNQEAAIDALKEVDVLPSYYANSMQTMLKSRSYWCISRQRSWGVPIPFFYNAETGKPLLAEAWIQHISSLVEQHGSNCWWSKSDAELLPKHIIEQCGGDPSAAYTKETDVLDIWFDSGASWASVLQDCDGVADVYLEGLDQLGGWFQSSLITSLVCRGHAPYKKLIVHGFVVDEDGCKMSKSVGNVIDPQAVINGTKVTDGQVKQPAYGVDVMRWWAAQSGLDAQVGIGSSVLTRCHEQVFKMRKNFRYLMGNLADFDVETDRVPYDNLLPQDKYMLHQLAQLCSEVTADYESFKYNHVLHCLETFSNSQISSFYSNITKDRLYCNPAEHPLRRACQTVQYELLSAMTCFLAPILPHLAEEVFQHPPFLPVENSIFKTSWYEADAQWSDAEVEAVISSAFCVRDRFNNLITTESPVQFHVIISAKPRLFEHLRVLQPELTSSSSALCEILQSSYVTLLSRLPVAVPDEANVVDGLCVHKDSDGSEVKDAFSLVVIPSEDYPCDRCRLHTARRRRELCERCSELMLDGWEK